MPICPPPQSLVMLPLLSTEIRANPWFAGPAGAPFSRNLALGDTSDGKFFGSFHLTTLISGLLFPVAVQYNTAHPSARASLVRPRRHEWGPIYGYSPLFPVRHACAVQWPNLRHCSKAVVDGKHFPDKTDGQTGGPASGMPRAGGCRLGWRAGLSAALVPTTTSGGADGHGGAENLRPRLPACEMAEGTTYRGPCDRP